MWIIDIIGEEPIIYKGILDELNPHQTPQGKSKIKISLSRRKSYHRTHLEEIRSRFDQVRPIVSHFEVRLPKKPYPQSIIGEFSNSLQRQLCKETLFVQNYKNINVTLISTTIPIKSSLKEKNSSDHSLLLVLRKMTVLMQ